MRLKHAFFDIKRRPDFPRLLKSFLILMPYALLFAFYIAPIVYKRVSIGDNTVYNNSIHYRDISPSNNPEVQNDPQLKNLYDSTVNLAVVSKDLFMSGGTGTILANTDVNHYPVIVTLNHVADTDFTEAPILLAFDHQGIFLGSLIPKNLNGNKKDGPVILAFDPHYPINDIALDHIHGALIANRLAPGPFMEFFGGSNADDVGVTHGSSGGGVYAKEDGVWKLYGLLAAGNSFKKDIGHLVASESQVSMPLQNLTEYNGMQYGDVPSNSKAFVLGLTDHSFLQSLVAVEKVPLMPVVTADVDYTHCVTFGYPYGIAAFGKGYVPKDGMSGGTFKGFGWFNPFMNGRVINDDPAEIAKDMEMKDKFLSYVSEVYSSNTKNQNLIISIK
jgi:hypothetical protein